MPQIRLLPIGRLGGLPTIRLGINGVFTTLPVDEPVTVTAEQLVAIEEAGFSYLTGANLLAEYPPYTALDIFMAGLAAQVAAGNFDGDPGPAGPPPSLINGTTGTGAPGSQAQFEVQPTNVVGQYRVNVVLPQGPAGSGNGDVLAANNGSEFTDKDLLLSNIGAGTGVGGGRALFKAGDAAAIRALLGLVTDANGKFLSSLMPASATGERFGVTSQAQMLALTAQIGDIAVRTDLNPARVFMLIGNDPTVLSNWQRQINPTDVVSSFAGLMGDITDVQAAAALSALLQPRDVDLDALAAIQTSSSFAYRASDGVWRAATLGTGLSVANPTTAPVLSATAAAKRVQTITVKGDEQGGGSIGTGRASYYTAVAQTVKLTRWVNGNNFSAISATKYAGDPGNPTTTTSISFASSAGATATVSLSAGESIHFTSSSDWAVIHIEEQ